MKRRAGAVLACVTMSAFLVAPTTAWAAPTRYEAENAPATCDGTIDSDHAGFSGSGFCNANNAVGAANQYTVSAASAGTATIQIRYANGGTADRPADILVNGSNVQPGSSFGPSGTWETWVTKSLTAQVNAGNNTIRLSPTTANGLANIDFVDFEVGGASQPPQNGKQMEDLNRGLVSLRSGNGNFVSWRMLGTDPSSVSYRLFRAGTLVASQSHTNFFDNGAPQGASYTVRAVINGVEGPDSEQALQVGSGGFLDVPLQVPGGGTTPDGVAYTYSANDASVGDLDGDGQYEFIVKWDPSNSKDNSQAGFTGNVFVDAYRLNGQRLWRIDLGRNIRAGAHYTQFQVYDYDGDGRAEIAMKTADGTRSGTGQLIGDANADFRNSDGYILSGPEFLTMFDGLTGAIRSTVNYDPPRGTVSAWGDSYGNRVDRFLAGTAYLDGQRPSLIMARGYYTRTVLAAWDFRNGSLTKRWTFDSNVSGSQYTAQGNHQLSVADVDGDGRDEIIYGSMAVNDNGAPMWTTGQGHGDSLHVGDLIPSRAGLEFFKPTEDTVHAADYVGDARTGQLVQQAPSCGCDNGRGVADDVFAGNPGAEMWSSAVDGLRSATTNANLGRKPSSTNFVIWWDADPVRELLDQTRIDKYGTGGDTRLLTASGVASNNGTKATPALSGDIFGDWREEVVWRTTNSSALRIYFTPTPTTTRIFTLMHDPMYRVAIAWQNTAYNQPPHTSFFLGNGMSTPPQPNIFVR